MREMGPTRPEGVAEGPSYHMKPPRLDATARPSRLSLPGAARAWARVCGPSQPTRAEGVSASRLLRLGARRLPSMCACAGGRMWGRDGTPGCAEGMVWVGTLAAPELEVRRAAHAAGRFSFDGPPGHVHAHAPGTFTDQTVENPHGERARTLSRYA